MFHPEMNESLTFLVRSNQVIESCGVVNTKTALSIKTKFDKEECQDSFDTTICVKILQSIPSCLVKIDNVVPELTGTWRFSITSADYGGVVEMGKSCLNKF